MAFFRRLKNEVTDRNGNLKMCISCRHYFIIIRSLCLEICVENKNRKDISIYVLNTLIFDSLCEYSKTEFADEWNLLAKDIVDKASDVFQ